MHVKICGLRSRGDFDAAAEAGAYFGGIVFFPKSPRHVSLADAKWIVDGVHRALKTVVLTVDADDESLDSIVEVVAPDLLQLHGKETPQRTAEVRDRFRIPVMKAVGIAGEGDLAALEEYERVADQILVDARPPEGADLPGGNGLAFDWRLLQGRQWRRPWMLAGGLTAENVAEAMRLTGAEQVDVSSGVERSRGVKDPGMMARFVEAARRPQTVDA